MNRYPNWDIRLNQYISEVRDTPFKWGVHDCLSFANGAVTAQTGQGFADQWTGKATTARAAVRLYQARIRSEGPGNGPYALDGLLRRIEGWPSRGNVVARKIEKQAMSYALGVCLGEKIALLGLDHMQFLPMEKDDLVWAI